MLNRLKSFCRKLVCRMLILTARLHPKYQNYRKYYRHYKNNESKTLYELELDQMRKLKEIVRYAYQNIPFYKRLWDEAGANPNFSSLEEFYKFPIVSKHDLGAAIAKDEMGLEKWQKSELSEQATTGSSGRPFEFFEDRQWSLKKWGKKLVTMEWYDCYEDTAWANFWRGSLSPNWKAELKDRLLNRKTFCIYDPARPRETALTPERIETLLSELKSFQPEIIEGFVSSLNLVALYMLRNNLRLNFRPKAVVTGAEILTDEARANISRAFESTVFNRYGGTEPGLVGHECRHQAETDHLLHASIDTLFIETVLGDQSVKNEPGSLVITHLENHAVPLIRYEVGDILTIDSRAKCPCGLPYPLIRNLEGRVNDVFVLPACAGRPGGGLVSTHLWQNYIKKAPFIDQWQMIQEDLDKINIKVVVNQNYFDQKSFEHVQDIFASALSGCRVDWEIVSKIECGPGGKFRHCLSKLSEEVKRKALGI